MNVIVANRYESMLKTLNVDTIKTIAGVFEANQIASMFKNFFFQRMILDITAINNYKDIKNIQTLSISLDMDKVILLLDDSIEVTSPIYLSELISIGIYNFAKNLEEVQYLLEHPNTYRDVAHLHQLDRPVYNQVNVPSVPAPKVETKTVQKSTNVAQKSTKVIGVKNITKQTGATTLIYMLKKQLQKKYSVLSVEINKRDFMYFKEKNMISINEGELKEILIQNSNKDVILLDVNESKEAISLCSDVIYLIEPSIVKLHKMMFVSPNILESLRNKKIVLNQSLLDTRDVKAFENEANLKIFFNVPPLDERKNDFPVLEQLLSKLGL